jgi:hypothetical protein
MLNVLPSWNDGIMEYWNVGKNYSLQTRLNPLFYFSSIPMDSL